MSDSEYVDHLEWPTDIVFEILRHAASDDISALPTLCCVSKVCV